MSLKCVCVCGLRYLFMTLQHYNLNYLVYLATCHEKKATEKKKKAVRRCVVGQITDPDGCGLVFDPQRYVNVLCLVTSVWNKKKNNNL